jgi:hypothetical protein
MKITILALLLLLVGCGGSAHPIQPPAPSVIFFGDHLWHLKP